MTTIKTNHHVYQALHWYEMSPKQQKQVQSAYGGLIDIESDESEFVFYRNYPYFMGDCMRLEHNNEFKDYDGYFSDTFFSTILVKFAKDEFGDFIGYKFAFAYC